MSAGLIVVVNDEELTALACWLSSVPAVGSSLRTDCGARAVELQMGQGLHVGRSSGWCRNPMASLPIHATLKLHASDWPSVLNLGLLFESL